MKKAKILVRYAGREQSLRAWAADNGAESNYSSVLKRWHAGVRDPDQLLMGMKMPPKPLKEEERIYLQETRMARQGMSNEWKIACDLIGWPRSRANDLKEAMG
jgi:hypothetical protein